MRFYSCVTRDPKEFWGVLSKLDTIQSTVPWFICFAARLILEYKNRTQLALKILDCLLDNPHHRRPSDYIKVEDFVNLVFYVLSVSESSSPDREACLILIHKIIRNYSRYQTYLVTSILSMARQIPELESQIKIELSEGPENDEEEEQGEEEGEEEEEEREDLL